jgi:hypothetical protein
MRLFCIDKNQFIITQDEFWLVNCDAHLAKFESKSSDVFAALHHSNEFGAK